MVVVPPLTHDRDYELEIAYLLTVSITVHFYTVPRNRLSHTLMIRGPDSRREAVLYDSDRTIRCPQGFACR